jgi:hypothetical protein
LYFFLISGSRLVIAIFDKNKISQRNIRLYNRGRFQEFRESLNKMEWESLLSDTNDIDQNWNKFNEIIKKK